MTEAGKAKEIALELVDSLASIGQQMAEWTDKTYPSEVLEFTKEVIAISRIVGTLEELLDRVGDCFIRVNPTTFECDGREYPSGHYAVLDTSRRTLTNAETTIFAIFHKHFVGKDGKHARWLSKNVENVDLGRWPRVKKLLSQGIVGLTELGAFKLHSQIIWETVHTAAELERNNPNDESTARLTVSTDPKAPSAILDGKPFSLRPDGAELLAALVNASGEWVSASKTVATPSRVLASFPKDIRDLVETKSGAGYRIPRDRLFYPAKNTAIDMQ